MTVPQPKPWIAAFDTYIGGKAKPGAAKLSSNESPLGPSPKAIAAMSTVLAQSHRYPEQGMSALRDRIAAEHKIEADRIVCGTGSDDLLYLLAQAYAGVGDEILYVRHGFMVYPLTAQRVGATAVAAPDRDFTAGVDALLAAVTPRTRVLFLANPNNPTGTMITDSELRRLHAGLREDIVLVIDAAYAEYVNDPHYDSGLALAHTAPNVIQLRTFSKIYGLAALRIGWGYGARTIVNTINSIRAPFNVASVAAAGALAALDDKAWIAQAKAHNDQWLAWLAHELASFGNLGLSVVPSVCNFLLLRFPETGGLTAEACNRWLAEHGYMVRWLPGMGLGDCLRISIGLEAETRGVAAAIRQFVLQAQG